MSEITPKQFVSGNALTRAMIAEMLQMNFEKLPDIDQKIFRYGPLYLGGNGALAGLISNSLYRKALNITQARIASNLPMALLPFLTTLSLYTFTVSAPLLAGDLNCPSCAVIRGALVGVFGGAVHPVLIALPLNLGLATRYKTAPMPEAGNVLRFGLDLSKPIVRRMRAVVVLQAIFGTFLSSRDFATYTKLAEMTFGPGGEELKE